MTSRISWFYPPGSIWIVVGTDTGENTGLSLCYTCQTSASPSGLKPEGEGLQKGLRGLCLPRCNLWSVAIRVQELVFLKCIMSVALLCCVVHVTEPLLPLSVQVPHLITSQHTYTQTHTHTLFRAARSIMLYVVFHSLMILNLTLGVLTSYLKTSFLV